MNNLTEILKTTKIYFLSRDLFYCLSGLFLFSILNFIFRPSLQSFANWAVLSTLERDVIILVMAYFFSRICSEISGGLIFLVEVVFTKDKCLKLKKIIEGHYRFLNSEPEDVVVSKVNIDNVEIEHFITKTEGLSPLYERRNQTLILLKVFLGFCFFLGVVYKSLFLILSLILLCVVMCERYSIFKLKLEIARFFMAIKNKAPTRL